MPLIATWTQALVVLAVIVPGFVYHLTRRRVRGPEPEEGEVTDRLLRAIATSGAFGAVYLVIFGDWVGRWWRQPEVALAAAQGQTRLVGLVVLVVVLILPWLAARIVYYVTTARWWLDFGQRVTKALRLQRHWDPTPNAWDAAFKDRNQRWWVRIRLPGGLWVGGMFSENSYASSWPQSRDIFIETAYSIDENGVFGDEVTAEGGIWVRCDEALTVDFLPVVEDHDGEDGAEGDDDGNGDATRRPVATTA